MDYSKLKNRWQREYEQRGLISKELREKILFHGKKVFLSYGIQRVVLFGSIAKGRATEKSDIDIIVFGLEKDKYWRFKSEIEEATGKTVDVYTDQDDPIFVGKQLAKGEIIYEA
ncbi:MAG: nucleotidyltransferase domain-containing protein [Candidatus Brocadiae bacterium]|nr:nucleotidyltransferase domain-containing protein [Candidatus Brocadiia bacterium]